LNHKLKVLHNATLGKFNRENNINYLFKKMNRSSPNMKKKPIKPLKLLKDAVAKRM